MRVIAGQYKGRPLKAPKGDGTRPTTDRVKETLMSSLMSAYGSFEGARVLDAFAGSGALGIECLSRGASCAHFFERDRTALAALRANISALGVSSERARVFAADVMKNPPLIGSSRYDIVFLDPPYAYPAADVLSLVRALFARGRLAEDAIVSYEHDAATDIAAFLRDGDAEMDILATKRFGGTVIDLLSVSPAGSDSYNRI